jgi:hypothetical protein
MQFLIIGCGLSVFHPQKQNQVAKQTALCKQSVIPYIYGMRHIRYGPARAFGGSCDWQWQWL